MSRRKVRPVFTATSSQGYDVVDLVSSFVSTDVTHVRRCEDGTVAALSRTTVDALVILAHGLTPPTMRTTVQYMTQGPLSPDGRHQWDGAQWVPIPKPPMDWWQLFCSVLLAVVVVVAVLALIAFTVDV
jgi:hypothetical protein